jgi:hypothetical protein
MGLGAVELLVERAAPSQHGIENIGGDPPGRETGNLGMRWSSEVGHRAGVGPLGFGERLDHAGHGPIRHSLSPWGAKCKGPLLPHDDAWRCRRYKLQGPMSSRDNCAGGPVAHPDVATAATPRRPLSPAAERALAEARPAFVAS